MARNPHTRVVARLVVAIGILLSMLVAGAAPSDFGHGPAKTVQPTP